MPSKPSITVIGGGTGTFVALSGLKKYPVSLSAIVTMSDSGGSTGRLRDQLGVLPPGDVRQALVALSKSEDIWRDLFTYRFKEGDLAGHNFGNLFISALEKLTGSPRSALKYASKLLGVTGRVIPVTYTNCTLCAKYADGSVIEGESDIDTSFTQRPRILYMYLVPKARLNRDVLPVMNSTDMFVLGPGDLHTSIFPNFLVDGFIDAFTKAHGLKVFVLNLMTKLGQTDGFTARMYVDEVLKYVGESNLDVVLVNNSPLPKDVVSWYGSAGSVSYVKDDLPNRVYRGIKIIRKDILSTVRYEQSLADRVKRSLIRHDGDKLALALLDLM